MPRAGVAIKPLMHRPKDPGGCWDWVGPKSHTGHGHKTVDGKPVLAHRWIWETFFGPIPPGLVIFADCGTRGCVNPWHLRCGTQAENVRRGLNAVLTPEDVVAIKRAKADRGPNTARVLAEQLGCHISTIKDIWRGHTWGRTKKPFLGAHQPRNQYSPVPAQEAHP